MTRKHLHIIVFDIPYPADYGGVIDVFYQIRALYRAGIKIHLHCFQYGGRIPHRELDKYCVSVKYYKRRIGILSFLSKTPYIIRSRRSRKLERRLLRNNFPILCQGIHTCGIVLNPFFENRRIFMRATNVEHDYYSALAETEKNPFKRFYFRSEAGKLQNWEKNLSGVKGIITVSDEDNKYFSKVFSDKKVVRVFGFNAMDDIESSTGKGRFALFHANLSIAENNVTAEFIISKVAPLTNFPIVIAGKSPSTDLLQRAATQKNVEIIANPSEFKMQNLIMDAHIHLMITFQPTGFKLKLITSLFNGRFVIANDEMLHGSGLDNCVVKANSAEEIMSAIHNLKERTFDKEEVLRRKNGIAKQYFNPFKAKQIIKMIYGDK